MDDVLSKAREIANARREERRQKMAASQRQHAEAGTEEQTENVARGKEILASLSTPRKEQPKSESTKSVRRRSSHRHHHHDKKHGTSSGKKGRKSKSSTSSSSVSSSSAASHCYSRGTLSTQNSEMSLDVGGAFDLDENEDSTQDSSSSSISSDDPDLASSSMSLPSPQAAQVVTSNEAASLCTPVPANTLLRRRSARIAASNQSSPASGQKRKAEDSFPTASASVAQPAAAPDSPAVKRAKPSTTAVDSKSLRTPVAAPAPASNAPPPSSGRRRLLGRRAARKAVEEREARERAAQHSQQQQQERMRLGDLRAEVERLKHACAHNEGSIAQLTADNEQLENDLQHWRQERVPIDAEIAQLNAANFESRVSFVPEF